MIGLPFRRSYRNEQGDLTSYQGESEFIVVVVTGATIYNAFHIAVLERMRQFGLLRA